MRALLVSWLLIGALCAGAVGQGTAERLVPAVYRQMKDDLGNEWSFQQNGVLGKVNNSMMSGGLVLQIGGQQFYNYQPLMTLDGLEYVLDNNQQNIGLVVTRRVRLIKNDGVVRYLESIENPSATPVTTMVELKSNLSGKFSALYSDRGRLNPTALEKRESGVLAVPKTSGQKAWVFTVAAAKSALKPTVTQQNGYQLSFQFAVTVPAGGEVTLMHTVTQVDLPEKLDSKTVSKVFRSATLARAMKSVRDDLRATLENYQAGGAFGNVALLSAMGLDGLGVERARSDVLALGESTRLLGKASCGKLLVRTDYGEAEVPFDRVVALVGGNRGRSKVSRVFLRDGQVFNGEVVAEDLRFVMPNGAKLDLEMANLDRLVKSEEPGEGAWASGVVGLLETYRGDRIALQDGAGIDLTGVTPWGAVRFSMGELLWLSPPDEEPVGHHVELRDGSRFFAFLGGGEVNVKSELFGEQVMESRRVRSVVTAGAVARAKEAEDGSGGAPVDPARGQPHLVLSGGQRLIGQIDAAVIGAVTNAELIELPPETVRSMKNLRDEVGADAGEAAPFRIELWGGSVVRGALREPVLPVRVRSEVWQIPVGDIDEVVTPLPRISDASRVRIGELIRSLGSDDWRKREEASEELEEFGYLAKPLLSEALNVNPDPEVRRRLEKLLEEME